jgi:hypothetical protein
MTVVVIPASELSRRREERERLRKQREAFKGSILSCLLDDKDDPPCAPASPAQPRQETQR